MAKEYFLGGKKNYFIFYGINWKIAYLSEKGENWQTEYLFKILFKTYLERNLYI